MTFILYVLLGLFGLKILWNLCVPYESAWKMARGGRRRSEGITLMPGVEIGLLILASGVAGLSGGRRWLESLKMFSSPEDWQSHCLTFIL